MLTDAEIAGYMGWRGPGAYTEAKMRRVKEVIAEAVRREREDSAITCESLGCGRSPDVNPRAGITCAASIRVRVA